MQRTTALAKQVCGSKNGSLMQLRCFGRRKVVSSACDVKYSGMQVRRETPDQHHTPQQQGAKLRAFQDLPMIAAVIISSSSSANEARPLIP